jgi:hypothetical protein
VVHRIRPLAAFASLVVVALCAACDSPAPDTKPEADAKAAAEDAALKMRAAEREAKAATEKQAAVDLVAAIDELTVLPEKLPKDLEIACKGMAKAYDAYMRTVLEGDMKTKWETGGNEAQMTVFDAACKKKASLEAAACQTEAFGKMTPEHEPHLSAIMTRCVQEFAKPAE